MSNLEFNKERTVAVVIGLRTNGLANVRALGQNGIPVIIFLLQPESKEVYAATRYGQKKIVAGTDGAAILDDLQSLPTNTRYILYPTTDSQVKYLSTHRSALPPNCVLQFPAESVVEMLLYKDQFDTFCRAHNFPVPAVFMLRNRDDLQQASQDISFPIIAKTLVKAYKPGLQKAYILSNWEELCTWYDSIQEIHGEFILQEYIPGTDRSVFFTMQYISTTGKLLASFTGRKIRQWLPLRGGTASAEPSYNEFLTNLTYDFFSKAGFFGIGSMEYKHDPRTGKFYLIEPTVCRTDFQEGVAIANGVNIPLIAYQDITGRTVQPVFQRTNARKAWMHVLNDRLARDWYLSQKQLTYFQWLISLWHVRSFDAFSFRDPGPFVLTLWNKITNRVSRFFQK
jgi:D-aspartate ligase